MKQSVFVLYFEDPDQEEWWIEGVYRTREAVVAAKERLIDNRPDLYAKHFYIRRFPIQSRASAR